MEYINLKTMKNKKLSNLETLSLDELKNTQGGEPVSIAIGIAGLFIGVSLWVASEWDCLKEGYNEVRNK